MTEQVPAESRLGICLTGGGITGAMYEVGVLAALEDTVENLDVTVHVGAASGAVVATALAAGLPAQRLYRAFLDPADDFFPLQRQHLLRFDGREIKRMSSSALGALRRIVGSVASKPLELDLGVELDRFTDSLPAGLFRLDAFEQFLEDVFQRRGIPKSFQDMPGRLFVIANDLDQGERVVFGAQDDSDPPVPTAIVAACAAPILYAPVRVGERDLIAANAGEIAHVDIAAEAGCTTVLVINPMVPVSTDVTTNDVPTGHGRKRRVRDKGLLWVYSQAWRLVTEARLQRGLESYRTTHPSVRVVLIEPERSDVTMFMHSPMNFAARRVILEDAYTSTVRQLRDESSGLHRALTDAGLTIRADQV